MKYVLKIKTLGLELITKSKNYYILEIKPCGLGSRIRDMEADLIYS